MIHKECNLKITVFGIIDLSSNTDFKMLNNLLYTSELSKQLIQNLKISLNEKLLIIGVHFSRVLSPYMQSY